MSCFIVSHAHIDAILDIHDQFHNALPSNVKTKVGKALLLENIKSYAYRYLDEDENALAADALTYQYRGTAHKFTAEEAYGILSCYDYQACEHPQYETSEAKQMITKLRDRLNIEPPKNYPIWSWNTRLPLLDIQFDTKAK